VGQITNEELIYLKQKLEILEEQYNKINDVVKDSDDRPLYCGVDGFESTPDYLLYDIRNELHSKIRELKQTISESMVVAEISDDTVELGSKFYATVDGEKDLYMLYGGIYNPDFDDCEFIPVSINSPFGKAVVSKKVGDDFSFVTPKKVTVKGVVDEIVVKNVKEDSKDKQLKKVNN